MDLKNLFSQAKWLKFGLDGERKEVGPGKVNDDITVCRMTAGEYSLELNVL